MVTTLDFSFVEKREDFLVQICDASLVSLCSLYFCQLCMVIGVYSVILFLYRKSKKNILKSNVGMESNPEIKNTVFKSLSVLISHIRAATYVLVIVAVYFLAWAPFFGFCILNSVNHLGKPPQDLNALPETSHINIKLIKECLKYAIIYGDSCSFHFESSNVKASLLIQTILNSEKIKTKYRLVGVYLSLLNSFANPILYAFWYPVFRTCACQIVNKFKTIIVNCYHRA